MNYLTTYVLLGLAYYCYLRARTGEEYRDEINRLVGVFSYNFIVVLFCVISVVLWPYLIYKEIKARYYLFKAKRALRRIDKKLNKLEKELKNLENERE